MIWAAAPLLELPRLRWSRGRVAATLLLVAGVIGALAILPDLSALLSATAGVWTRPDLLSVFLATYAGAFACRAVAWRLLLRNGPGAARLFSILHVALLANHVFPTKVGETVRAALLSRAGAPLGEAVASTVLARLFDFAVLCSLGLAIAVLLHSPGASESTLVPAWLASPVPSLTPPSGGALAVPLACLALATAVYWSAASGRLLPRTARLPRPMVRLATEIVDALRRVSLQRTAVALLLVVPSWLLEAGALWAVAQAAGNPLSPEVAAGATAIAVACQVFQVTPGGIGLYEASMTGALALFGVSPEAGLPIAVGTHLLKFAYAFAAGLPCLVLEGLAKPAGVAPFPGSTTRLLPVSPFRPLSHLLAAALWFAALLLLLAWAAVRLRRAAARPLPLPSPPETGSLITIVIPVHNEVASIGSVVAGVPRDELRRAGYATQVVVVDDGSGDASGEVARAAGSDTVLCHPRRRGLGAALRTGLAHAGNMGAMAVYLDGDGEYDPRDIPAVIAPVLRGEADYVLGVRFPAAEGLMCPARRRGNRVFTHLMRLITGRPLLDAQTGIRAFSARAVACAEIIHDYNYAQVLTLDLLGKGMRLAQVPVHYRLRETGASFIRYGEYLHRVFSAMVRQLLRV